MPLSPTLLRLNWPLATTPPGDLASGAATAPSYSSGSQSHGGSSSRSRAGRQRQPPQSALPPPRLTPAQAGAPAHQQPGGCECSGERMRGTAAEAESRAPLRQPPRRHHLCVCRVSSERPPLEDKESCSPRCVRPTRPPADRDSSPEPAAAFEAAAATDRLSLPSRKTPAQSSWATLQAPPLLRHWPLLRTPSRSLGNWPSQVRARLDCFVPRRPAVGGGWPGGPAASAFHMQNPVLPSGQS